MRRLTRFVDPFLVLLVATVALAALLPASGPAAEAVSVSSKIAIGLLFFLYGARLSTRETVDGLRHWRLHLTVVACTFLVFPLLGLAARGLVPHVLTEELWHGLLFLCIVPSTVQSSIAFTSMARGNVPAAICAGTYSSLLGIVLTPLLAGLFIASGAGFSAESLLGIGSQLLLPFLAGQLLRRWIGAFVTRHRAALSLVDRGAILLVVYTAFSQGMTEGVWERISPWRLAGLFGAEAVLLTVMLLLTAYGSRALRFDRADRVTVLFAGSKKSLAAGLPMAAVLFGAQASLAVLPLMLFHQMQLMVCAVIARRLGRRAEREQAAEEGEAGDDPQDPPPRDGPGST
ncbi:bile acid:sodium symporter family protein [Streptomyces sp. 549]|uniref:bile acid:sodium symporter family protein n=1 Tax=Streptomyces sp. 549 TaxID=3049076 RepID=UPI0024C2AD1A|nr:bile acid:sodium symporter family protein [Streptomyces sp. 549]MDK1472099.1 bile acid:sodium symporter family protein [Streptomyces sp. 549]